MKSLYTDIVREIKSQIYNGILLEGDKLPSERELSTQYNVSRNVVREAIGALRANGLIKVQAGKGTYVLEPSPTIVTDTLERIMNDFDITIEEILEVREELEVSIIRKAVSSASDSDIEHLKTVYENMETNIKDIYACGDIAEFKGRVYGTWPAAVEMGKAAGINAVGDSKDFVLSLSAISFNAMDLELLSVGEVSNNSSKAISLKDDANKIYKKLFFTENILTGGILIGDTKAAAKLINAIEESKSLEEVLGENIL